MHAPIEVGRSINMNPVTSRPAVGSGASERARRTTTTYARKHASHFYQFRSLLDSRLAPCFGEAGKKRDSTTTRT